MSRKRSTRSTSDISHVAFDKRPEMTYYVSGIGRPIVRSLSTESTRTLVQTFISCRLDDCNSVLYGISNGLLRPCTAVGKNAAARLVTGTRRHEHITPVSRQLHWLPLRQRICFKLAGFLFQSLAGLPRRRLPSSIAHWPSYSLCWHQNLCRSPEKKHSVRRQKFLKLCMSKNMEQSTVCSSAEFKQHRKSYLFNASWDWGA